MERENSNKTPEVSVVVPISERHDDMKLLYNLYADELKKMGKNFEFLFIVDGNFPIAYKDLKTLKEEDLGISVVVSGLISEIRELCQEIGLNMHTANLSLGEFGKKSLLPPEKTLEITTMCSHHCVSSQSVLHYARLIKEGKISLEKAAEKLTAPCVCGIFNTKRAGQILENLEE